MSTSEETLKTFEALKAKRYNLQRELDFVESEIEKTKFVLDELIDRRDQILSEL
jgi:hypothetical protein